MYDGVTAAIAADRPDVLVVDMFSSAGISAADVSGVPIVVTENGIGTDDDLQRVSYYREALVALSRCIWERVILIR